MKRIYLVLFIFSVLVACNSKNTSSDATKLAINSFDSVAANFVEKAVIIEGTVSHTCKHGGKRMFLIDNADSINVEITAGKDISKFDESLEGKDVVVYGILKEERIDEKYLSQWESELKAKENENHEGTGVHTGVKGHEDQGVDAKMQQINDYRKQIADSGKDHLSFYSVEAEKFELKQK